MVVETVKGVPFWGIVNNAGTWGEQSVLTVDDALWNKLMSLNLYAPYYIVSRLQQQLTRPGRIVNISSQLGIEGRKNMGAYVATKHGLNGLTKTWAEEIGREGICVNSVCPGWVRTQSNHEDLKRFANETGVEVATLYSDLSNTLGLGRLIEEEVANLVNFLLSDESSGINGQVYLIR
jgi:3-hydroxybutyrate dehydrogenase